MTIGMVDSGRLIEFMLGIILIIFSLISFSDDRRIRGIVLLVLGGFCVIDMIINGIMVLE
jgi:hypothetical protein